MLKELYDPAINADLLARLYAEMGDHTATQWKWHKKPWKSPPADHWGGHL
jgi:hypothetical protein